MKSTKLARYRWIALPLILGSVAATGCKSNSWKMPGSSMFAFGREPDAAKLAAGGSEVDEPNVTMPESPAGKYSPTAIASLGGQAGSQGDASSTNPYAYAGGNSANNGTGLAAKANGYQTGPYQLAGSSGSGSSPYGSSGSSSSMPNPYGGSYTGGAQTNGGSSAATTPDIALPSGVKSQLASESGSGNPYAQMGSYTAQAGASGSAGTGAQGGSYGQQTTPYGGSGYGAASGYASSGYGTSSTSGSNPSGYGASMPSASAGSSSGGYTTNPASSTASSSTAYTGGTSGTTNSQPTFPPIPGSQTGGVSVGGGGDTASALPPMPADGGSTGASTSIGFQPGTTARNTKYDFSGSGGSTEQATSEETSSLPPNTASGAESTTVPNGIEVPLYR